MDGRVESFIVNPEMPALEDGTGTAEPTERPFPGGYTNEFISRLNNATQRKGPIWIK